MVLVCARWWAELFCVICRSLGVYALPPLTHNGEEVGANISRSAPGSTLALLRQAHLTGVLVQLQQIVGCAAACQWQSLGKAATAGHLAPTSSRFVVWQQHGQPRKHMALSSCDVSCASRLRLMDMAMWLPALC
jgi:hypothetical protein